MIPLLLAEENRGLALVVAACLILFMLDYYIWLWGETLHRNIFIGPLLDTISSYINIILAFGGMLVAAKICLGQVTPAVAWDNQQNPRAILIFVGSCLLYTVGYELTRLKQ